MLNEIEIAGSLVGNYTELAELMELNAEGPVTLQAQRYSLNDQHRDHRFQEPPHCRSRCYHAIVTAPGDPVVQPTMS